MSHPHQDGADFQIHTDPPIPSARELVDTYGADAVRGALPSSLRQSFDTANPWANIERGEQLVQTRTDRLNNFEQNVQQGIDRRGYTPAEAAAEWTRWAPVRQEMRDAAIRSLDAVRNAHDTYRTRLAEHVERHGQTSTVATRLGLYSTAPLNTAAAAALDSQRNGRGRERDRDGPSGGSSRAPLGSTSGNKRPRGRR
ncbi:hypothetical protein HTV45_26965 [Streptomyces sp. CHD11]|uniref:hypothetical protein n=1 Tax=Streptomyces sp. CHD11 TaxID=2741325 RepID=UPI001BFC851E|nr:hypothetical protein [Streptomyces sp. CHD11]MBT3154467.1 hypothetical protein [Streptomyces sp. CHD11]